MSVLVEMLNIVGERERPNLGFVRDVRAAKRVVSAQLSFREARPTCRRYMRTVHWQNGEQVSRTVHTLRFQLVSRGPPGSWHAAVSALAYFQVAPSNHEDWEEVQHRSVTEGCSACRRMEESSLAG